MSLTNPALSRGGSPMFVDFYRLREDPFGQPDPRFIYLGANHRKALAALHYGIEHGDAIQLLLADAGLGKTTLLRHLHARLQANARVILRAAADLKQSELLDYDADAQRNGRTDQPAIAAPSSPRASGASPGTTKWRLIVLIDDAHDLGDAELGGLLALAMADSAGERHTHIIFAARPRLVEKLRKLDPKKTFRQVHIAPMSPVEASEYIDHRLRIAAGSQPALFTPAAYVMIAEQSGGVAGVINTISAKALAVGAELRLRQIDTSVLDRNAADERARFVMAPPDPEAPPTWPLHQRYLPTWPWLALVSAVVIAAATGFWYENQPPANHPVEVTKATSPGKADLPSPVHAIVQQALPRQSNQNVASVSPPQSVAAVLPQMSPSAPSAPAHHQAVAITERPIAHPAPPLAKQAIIPRSETERRHSAEDVEFPPRPAPAIMRASVIPSVPAAGSTDDDSDDYADSDSAAPAPVADPHQAKVDAMVGDDYMRLGKYRQAIAFYEDAVAFAPTDMRIKQKLAEARIAALRE